MAEVSKMPPPLSQGTGYGLILGLGFAFAIGMIGTTWALKRYHGEVQTSEAFSTANRTVKSGLVSSAVVSSWTWAVRRHMSRRPEQENRPRGTNFLRPLYSNLPGSHIATAFPALSGTRQVQLYRLSCSQPWRSSSNVEPRTLIHSSKLSELDMAPSLISSS